MRNVTVRTAAGPARFLRLRVLGIAALALILTGAGEVGNTAAGSFLHDAPGRAEAHQAESPNLATPVSETLLSGCLIGSWTHSWEEDTAETIIFRPADYPFAPSRGRESYEFQTGGILVYHGFGPADEPLTSVGEWGWHSGDLIHLVVNDPQGAYIDEVLRIVSCDAEALQVERVVEEDA
jgi:hypothetical protein